MAVRLCEESIRELEESRGNDDGVVTEGLQVLENVYRNQIDYYERKLHIAEENLSPNNLKLALTKNLLAKYLAKQGRFQEAEEYFKGASSIFERMRDNHNLADSLLNLGKCLLKQRKLEEAEASFENSIRHLSCSLRDLNCLKSADAMRDQANCYMELGEYKQAELLLREALDIYGKQLEDTEELIIADLKNNIGLCVFKQVGLKGAAVFNSDRSGQNSIFYLPDSQQWLYAEDTKEMEDLSRAALEIYAKHLSKDYTKIIRAKHILAGALYNRDKFNEAEVQLEGAIKMIEGEVDFNKEQLIDMKELLSYCFVKLKEAEKA